MNTIFRLLAFSALLVVAAGFSAPASARALGGISIDTTGPVTPTPLDPWGGVMLCTAHLRKMGPNGWQYHTASGYNREACERDAARFPGYEHNPNPGLGFCQCHSGFNGYMVSSPKGNGPLGVQNLSRKQVQLYDEGLLQLRQKYHFDKFVQEHELLLQAIESMPPLAGDH